MPLKFKDILPEKDYAGWLVFGLILMLISQMISTHTGWWVPVVRWLLLVAALVNYLIVLMRYDRNRRTKEKEKTQDSDNKEPKA
jgi:Ca2+/Na+ antiporter